MTTTLRPFTPQTPPFRINDDGFNPAISPVVRAYPGLPIKRLTQTHSLMQPLGIVIEAGEPVGVVTFGGKKYLVPAAITAYTLTHSALDVGVTEDPDVPGSMVAAAGASTATIPACLPIGLANHPIPANSEFSDETLKFYNYKPEYKEVILRRCSVEIPYLRSGPNAIGTVREGELLAIGAINGNTLSATNRPRIIGADIQAGTITAATRGTIVVTPTFANVTANDRITLTVDGVVIDFKFVADATAHTNTTTLRHVTIGAAIDDLVTNLAAVINASALVPVIVSAVADLTNGVEKVTVTAKEYGADTALAYAEVLDAADGFAPTVTQGTNGAGAPHVNGTIDAANLGTIIGRVLWASASLVGSQDLSKVYTPRGSGLSGSDTNGVPQHLYVTGNTTEGNQLPSTTSNAGVIRFALVL